MNLKPAITISRRLYEELKAFLDGDGIKPAASIEALQLLTRLRDSDGR